MSLPIVGARISLVSKSNIRFVGTLHSINHEESSVSLEQVYSFGTEGRAGHPDKEIPPQPQVFPLIVFKGTDVKDLKVEENPQQMPMQQQQPWGFQTNQSYFNPYQPIQSHQPSGQSMYWQPPSTSSQAPPGYGLGFNGPSVPGFSAAAPPFGTSMNASRLGGAEYGNGFGGNNNNNSSASVIAPSRPPVRIEQPKSQKQQSETIRTTAPSSASSQISSALPPANAAITFGKTGPIGSMNSISTNPWKTAVADSVPAPVKKLVNHENPMSNKTITSVSVPSAYAPVKSALQVNQDIPETSLATSGAPQKVIQLKDIRSNRKVEGGAVVEKSFADFDDEEVENKQGKGYNSRTGNNVRNSNTRPAQSRDYKNERGERRQPKPKMVIPTEEFDFEQSNAKFARDDVAADDNEEDENVVNDSGAFYKKSSFFDDISSDSKDRAAHNEQTFDRRAKMNEDRKLNMETFGQSGIRRGGRGRGGNYYRGGGRGGRGGRNHNADASAN